MESLVSSFISMDAISKKRIKNKIIHLCHQIIQLTKNELEPIRTKLLGELIFLIKKYDGVISITEAEKKQINVVKLWQVFSLEQMCIEKYWAQKVISSPHPLYEITQFPFYRGYISTAEYLYDSLKMVTSKPIKKVLYVGSGALPLNPILLAQKYRLNIYCIEKDYESYQLSLNLLRRLNLTNRINVIYTNILHYKQLRNYDIIICAILVGDDTKMRQRIINHISKYMKLDGLFVIKNVNGLRTLLYPPISTEIFKNLKIEAINKKQTELTNILIITRKLK